MENIVYGDWQSVFFCTNCKKQLTWLQITCSDGSCPYCNNNPGGVKIVDHYKQTVRKVYQVVPKSGLFNRLFGRTEKQVVRTEIKL